MGTDKQYVAFALAGQWYGAPIEVVREVNYVTPITRLPNAPDYVDGVIDLRGEILPVIDLHKRLGLSIESARAADARFMVLSLGERSAVIIVDAVDQVLTLDPDAISPPDANLVVSGKEWVTGVTRLGDRLLIVLNMAAVITPVAA